MDSDASYFARLSDIDLEITVGAEEGLPGGAASCLTIDKHKVVAARCEVAEEIIGERKSECAVVLEVGVAEASKLILLGGADTAEVGCAVIVQLGHSDGEGARLV